MPDTDCTPPSRDSNRAAIRDAVTARAIRIANAGGDTMLLLRSSRAAGALSMTVGDVIELLGVHS